MSTVFDLVQGTGPLLVSMPHSGLALAPGLADRLTPAAAGLPDTDWDVPTLYDFLDELDATVICANYSRYVIDLNRDPSGRSLYPGQATTGLAPTEVFDGSPVYRQGQAPDAAEMADRLNDYYWPYHNMLEQQVNLLRQRNGHVVLWDAHSIASRVPRLFQGRLPDLNLGTYSGASCDPAVERAAIEAMSSQGAFSTIANGRFKGGWITRRYGDPANRVHALQMEIGRDAYCDPDTGRLCEARAERLRPILKSIMEAAMQAARALAG